MYPNCPDKKITPASFLTRLFLYGLIRGLSSLPYSGHYISPVSKRPVLVTILVSGISSRTTLPQKHSPPRQTSHDVKVSNRKRKSQRKETGVSILEGTRESLRSYRMIDNLGRPQDFRTLQDLHELVTCVVHKLLKTTKERQKSR